jgi:hypothetical protein
MQNTYVVRMLLPEAGDRFHCEIFQNVGNYSAITFVALAITLILAGCPNPTPGQVATPIFRPAAGTYGSAITPAGDGTG